MPHSENHCENFENSPECIENQTTRESFETRDAFDRRVSEDTKRLERGTARYICGFDGCKKQASYGFVRDRPLACAGHVYDHPQTKVPMTCVTNLCKLTDDHGNFVCTNAAGYGIKGKGGGKISCREHREDMARHHGVDGLCYKSAKECRTDGCFGIGIYSLKSEANDKNKTYLCCKHVTRCGELVDPLYEYIGSNKKCKVTRGCKGEATYCSAPNVCEH